MVASKIRGLVHLSEEELDQPIYRIYALDRFKALVAAGQDALVHPTKWDDPFENFMLARTEVQDPGSRTSIPLRNLAEDWYGQCWSLTCESDAMWRIYSPSGASRGVKVKTTIRRLFDNLTAVGPAEWPQQFFVGRIRYVNQAELDQMMARLTFADVAAGGQGTGFAELLCLKRDTFAHENEVRLLFQDMALPDPPRPRLGSAGVFKYPLDAHYVFEDVVLDPRLEDTDFLAMKSELEAAGCRLPISKSSLYEVPRYVIPLA